MMIEQSVGSLDTGTGLMTELEQLGIVPVGAESRTNPRPLEDLLQPAPPTVEISPLPSNLAALLKPSPPLNNDVAKKGSRGRRRSYDSIVKQTFKNRVYEEPASPITGEYAFSLNDTMKEPEPPKKQEGRGLVNPHVRPGVVLTVAEEDWEKKRRIGGRKSFKQKLAERDAAASAISSTGKVEGDLKPKAPVTPKMRRSFAGITKAGLAKTRLLRDSTTNAPKASEEEVVTITDPAIKQALKTRDKQRGAKERRKSLDEKRRSSLSSVNELKKRRIFENLTRESQMIRQSESRLAPVKAWLMCLALSKRHEKLKAKFIRYREGKSRREAAKRIQKGWRGRPKEKKYETIIAAIKKHNKGQTFYRVVAKRKKNAGPLLQRWLVHMYRNKRFTGWGAIIKDRTISAQRAARSYLRCTEWRTRAMLLLWDKGMEKKGYRSKLEAMRKEILGDEQVEDRRLREQMVAWTKSWIRSRRLEFIKSENARFSETSVSSKVSTIAPVYTLCDAQALLSSGAPLAAPLEDSVEEEAKLEYGIKMRPPKETKRVWRNITIYKNGANFTSHMLEQYKQYLIDMAEQRRAEIARVSPPSKEAATRAPDLTEKEGHRMKFGLGYAIA
jgi:hypothetical protein